MTDALATALEAVKNSEIFDYDLGDDGVMLCWIVDMAVALVLAGENYQKLLDAQGVEEAYKSITLKWTETELGVIEPGLGAFKY